MRADNFLIDWRPVLLPASFLTLITKFQNVQKINPFQNKVLQNETWINLVLVPLYILKMRESHHIFFLPSSPVFSSSCHCLQIPVTRGCHWFRGHISAKRRFKSAFQPSEHQHSPLGTNTFISQRQNLLIALSQPFKFLRLKSDFQRDSKSRNYHLFLVFYLRVPHFSSIVRSWR